MNWKTMGLACLAAAMIFGAAPAQAQGKPDFVDHISTYQNLQTDPQFIALKRQLPGNLDNDRVVDQYLQYLPISPLTMLEIDMHLNRYEYGVPSYLEDWHQRWIELHPQKAEKLYGVPAEQPSPVLGAKAEGAGTGEKIESISAAATVGTNRNAATDDANPPEEYQGEVQVAVNPNDPSQVVAASNTWDEDGGNCGDFGTQAVVYSSDGGDTWNYTCTPDDVAYGLNCDAFGGGTFGSDPAVFWNDNNEVFVEYMLLCDDGSTTHYSIVISKSTDGGATWTGQGIVTDSWGDGFLEDKEFLAIDNNSGSPFYGRMYTCWDRDNNEKSAYSTDGGATWNEVDLPTTPSSGGGGLSSPADLACELAVEDDGTVHVVYDTLTCGIQSCNNEQKFYARSTDGGQSWSSPIELVDFNLVGFSGSNCPDAQDGRCISPFGAIAVDNSGGACDGNLYVTYTDYVTGDVNNSDVWLIRSTDGGATWSSAVRINDDGTGGNVQFHPFLDVDQSTGDVVVVWHDARNDADNREVDYFLARSTDCGQSFQPNVQVSAPSSEFHNSTISWSNASGLDNANNNPNQYGEYMGLDVHQGTAYVAWSDTRQYFPDGSQDAANEQENIGFAKVTFVDDTTPPAAPTNLAATGGEGVVDLTWDDNTESDLAGYNVYRSTTSGSGYSQINGSLVTSSSYSDSNVTGGTTYFYVVTAVDNSSNESANSNEASATPTEPVVSTMHVDSIVVAKQNEGGGSKSAVATVTIVDETGAAVGNATVSGEFTGDVTDTDSGVTAGDGTVTLQSNPTSGRLKFTFCVTDVTHASLTYDSSANVETCDSN